MKPSQPSTESHRDSFLSKKSQRLFFAAALAVGITVLLSRFGFTTVEAWLYDLRMSSGSPRTADSRIVIVEIDRETLDAFDDLSPLSLDFHTRFLEVIEENYSPRAIGYLVNTNGVHQINPDLFQIDWGDRFVKAADRLVGKGIPVLMGTDFDANGEVLPPYPLNTLTHAISSFQKENAPSSEDSVIRRAPLSIYGKPAFHLKLAQMISGEHRYVPIGSFYSPDADTEYFYFQYQDDREDAYRRISFKEILYKKIPSIELQGKILLVGTRIHENPSDFALSPLRQQGRRTSKLWIHANILDNVVNNSGLRVLPQKALYVLTAVIVGIVAWWGVSYSPLAGAMATLGLIFGFFFASYGLFRGMGPMNGVWLKESQPILGAILSYYIVVPFRLMREYRRRWALQERNTLLTQVEELKTNFMNLVTHDLKTPVARVQGLSEMLLSKAGAKLTEEERRSLKQISASTDELNKFITGILELSNIDSKRLSLTLEQKDINTLIENAVAAVEPIASRKGIRIEMELDPLFPIRIDSRLIQKVLVNLIDNAVKYSPSDTKVIVTSREDEDFVEIAVRDQGIGLAPEEAQNLFTRFYRAKNEATASNPGTGLGLYLTKYFVEAHRGRVTVESAVGSGSVFRIFLPVHLPVTAPGLTTSFRDDTESAKQKENERA